MEQAATQGSRRAAWRAALRARLEPLATPSFPVLSIAFALLTLAFVPLWIDPEAARRGIGCVLIGMLLLSGQVRSVPWPLLAPMALALLSFLWSANGWEAALRLTWWAAILGALLWGRGGNPVTVARAILPAGAIVSAWALAQQIGFQWPFAEGLDLQASSTLGNRNTAAQVIAVTALAGAFAAGHGGRNARLAAGSVAVLAAVALGLHPAGSRGGILGLAAGLVWLLAAPQRRTYYRAVLAVLLATSIAWLSAPSGQAPPPPPPAADGAAVAEARPTPPTPSTVEVRLGLWGAAIELWNEHPLAGQGIGQLRVEFPRVRDAHEHDLSSYNRAFRTEVGHAHNDIVEVLVELGLLGVVALLLALGWIATRMRAGPVGLAGALPVIAALALGLTYSALLNAPVALALALWAGASIDKAHQVEPRSHAPGFAFRVCGAVIALAGVAPSFGHASASRFAGLVARHQFPPGLSILGAHWSADGRAMWLDEALTFMPWSDRLESALARRLLALHVDRRQRSGPGELDELLQQASRHAQRAHELAPHHVEHMILLGEIQVQRGDLKSAAEWVEKAMRVDPADPEAQTFAASLAYRAGDADRAVAMLYTDPHPRLREQWIPLLEQFRDLAAREGNESARLRFDAELAFVRTLHSLEHDELDGRDPQAWVMTGLERFRALENSAGGPPDLRPWILAAWLSHRLGDDETANQLGVRAKKNGAQLGTLVRPLVARYLEDLQALDGW